MSYQTREKGTDEKERKKTPHLLSSTRKKTKTHAHIAVRVKGKTQMRHHIRNLHLS